MTARDLRAYYPDLEPDPPCDICGHDPASCECPECFECSSVGDIACYRAGHLDPSLVADSFANRRHIAELEAERDYDRYQTYLAENF